jgi:hypothetical protein
VLCEIPTNWNSAVARVQRKVEASAASGERGARNKGRLIAADASARGLLSHRQLNSESIGHGFRRFRTLGNREPLAAHLVQSTLQHAHVLDPNSFETDRHASTDHVARRRTIENNLDILGQITAESEGIAVFRAADDIEGARRSEGSGWRSERRSGTVGDEANNFAVAHEEVQHWAGISVRV